jgi:hypothetical protein
MNKPVPQLELVPAAKVDDSPPTSTVDEAHLAALGRAGVPPATAERILAEAGPDHFDWTNDDSVVVKPRPGVAVYENKFGDVVVRTQDLGGEDDCFAYISPEGLPAVIKALEDYLP